MRPGWMLRFGIGIFSTSLALYAILFGVLIVWRGYDSVSEEAVMAILGTAAVVCLIASLILILLHYLIPPRR